MFMSWLTSTFKRIESHGWILILLVAAGARWAALDLIPPGTKYDTASSGVYALNVVFNGSRPFYINPSGAPEPLMVYLQALAISLFGVDVFALRFLSAAVGIIVVALLYAFARDITRDNRVALIAAFALAVAVEPTHVTRTGLRATLVPLFEMAWLLLFWRGWRTGRLGPFLSAGAILGLGFYTYLATLFVPVVAAGLWLHQFLFARADWRARLRPMGIMVAAAFVLVIPRLIFQVRFPQAAVQRAAQVSILQNPEVQTLGMVGALGKHLIDEVSLFGIAWQGELYNVLHRPLLDPFLFLCFLVGLVVTLAHYKRVEYAWAPLALVVMLLPDILGGSEVSPNELRTIGVIPPTYFLVGLGSVACLDWASRAQRLRSVVLVLIVLALGTGTIVGWRDYWGDYAAAALKGPDADYNRTEMAEAQWITQQREPVILPLNEYARSPVHFLTGERAAYLQSAFNVGSSPQMRPLPAHAWVLLPLDETRPRTEGKDYVPDPVAFVRIDDVTVSILPPAQKDVGAILAQREPTEEIRDSLGSLVALAFWVDDPSSLFEFQAPALQPVLAQLSQGISLVAAAVSPSDMEPGSSVDVSLFWRAEHPVSDDEIIFVHVLDVHQDTVVGADIIPALGAYPTYLWKPGELVATHHVLKLPTDTDPGEYSVEVGMYNILNESRLDVWDVAHETMDSRLVVGTFDVSAPKTTAVPQHIQTARFARAIRLLGWDAPTRAKPGAPVPISFYWQSLSRVSKDYTIYVHLLDEKGSIVAQADHQPLGGQYPTSLWQVGDQVHDPFVLLLPPDLPIGAYRIEIGWYNLQTGTRLMLNDGTDRLFLNLSLQIGP